MTSAGAKRDERPRDEPEHRAPPDGLGDEDVQGEREHPASQSRQRREEPSEQGSSEEVEARGRRRREDQRSGEAERDDETRGDEARRRVRPTGDHDEDQEDGGPREDGERPTRSRTLPAARAARLAMSQVAELTGREPESVTSLERADGGWKVDVEVVETRRIPDSADVLAIYEAELDEDGELVAYRRTRRYPRGRGQEG